MQTQHSRRHLISLLVVVTVVFSAATHTSANEAMKSRADVGRVNGAGGKEVIGWTRPSH